jgi:hypothetical protein
MGQVGELALHGRIECRTAPARRGGTPGPDGRRGADPHPLYHHRRHVEADVDFHLAIARISDVGENVRE